MTLPEGGLYAESVPRAVRPLRTALPLASALRTPSFYTTLYYIYHRGTRILFVETSVFTRRVQQLGLEDELRALQALLEENPEAGSTDAGTGGLRKVRLPAGNRNKGKRSGARVHYLHLAAHDVIYLLFVYGKNDQATLTPRQKRQLAIVAQRIKEEWAAAR